MGIREHHSLIGNLFSGNLRKLFYVSTKFRIVTRYLGIGLIIKSLRDRVPCIVSPVSER